MNKQQPSDDDVYNEEDQDPQPSQLEKSFINQCEDKKQVQQNLYSMNIPKPIQLMFILFSFYQEDIASIGIDFNCRVKISLDKIKIFSQNSEKDVSSCNAQIIKYLSNIAYTGLDHDNKQKILYSPYFKQKAELIGFRLCKFDKIIYCHTNKMNQRQLKSKMKQLFSGQYLFTVDIKFKMAKEKLIYNYLREYIKKLKQHDSKTFQQRQVVVQLDNTQSKVNCIGSKQRDLVAAKNTVKNWLESTVILIIKFQNQGEVDQKVQSIKTYTKQIVKYPICVAKIQKRAITIVSKQNIIRKLLEKEKILQMLGLNDKSQLGLFLPRRNNYRARKQMIQQICTKKGYDFTTLGGTYHYFKKMFSHQGEIVDPKQVLALINQVLDAIKQNKQRCDIPQQIKDKIKKQRDRQVMQGQYYSAGETSEDKEISKILKRNVLRQKLKMSKPALVKYTICDAPESSNTYWFIKDDKKISCDVKDMVVGTQYFSGKIKQLGDQKNYLFQYKLIIM